MTEAQTCLLCGLQDRDVRVGLVEIPPAEQRIVTVPIPVTFREGAVEVGQDVRERYAAMPRCRDTRACAARVRALEVEPEPSSDVEEVPSWLATS